MSDKAAAVEFRGLKCDAQGCDYKDISISVADYEKYIDSPCPCCGASLLTRADYELTKLIISTAGWLNETIKPSSGDTPKTHMRLNMNGSGFLESIDIEEPNS